MRQNYLDQEVTAGMLKLTFGTCDNGVVTWQIYMSSVISTENMEEQQVILLGLWTVQSLPYLLADRWYLNKNNV